MCKRIVDAKKGHKKIGVAGFEPVASTSRTWHSTKLSYTPMHFIVLRLERNVNNKFNGTQHKFK